MHTAAIPDLAQPIPVRVPPRSAWSDLRAIKIVWHREMLRFMNDKIRIVTALIQPMLYLFVFGSGMSSMVVFAHGMNFRTFLFPGVMAMAVLFTCFFSAGSLVWDREFGFMREMLVAPVRRGAIIVGKCLGGATVGAFTLASGSADTALIANLPPGSYTFQVTSASNATGEALGEVYELP